MKNLLFKITLTALLTSAFVLNAFSQASQDESFGYIFLAGPDAANSYIQKYTEVIGLSFNSGLGSGWYNTAKPHKLFGFDLTASFNGTVIPKSEILFDFNSSDFDNRIQYQGGGSKAPTLIGGSLDNPAILRVPNGTIISGDGGSSITLTEDYDFEAPEGLINANDFPVVGTPMGAVQLGIGLVKNTDLKIRYASDFGAMGEDGSLRLIGIGVLHDLKQWIPGLKQIPVDVSGFFGFTSLKVEYAFDLDETNLSVSNGLAELKANSTTLQVVASKKIAILTPYVGLGYNVASSSIKVNGQFVYQDDFGSVTINDPINLKFSGGSTARINAGLMIKLTVLTLHAEYAVQKYNTLTLGVGISIR